MIHSVSELQKKNKCLFVVNLCFVVLGIIILLIGCIECDATRQCSLVSELKPNSNSDIDSLNVFIFLNDVRLEELKSELPSYSYD